MILHDNIDINDSIVNGFCIAKTSTGEVLFKKHNMVVAGGRNAIYNMLHSLCTGSTPSPSFKFSSIKFGNNRNITTLNTDSISVIGEEYQYNFENNDENNNASIDYGSDDGSSRYFKFNINVDAKTPAELTELGLYFTQDNGSTETLFSRVVFDPIFCGPNAAVSSFTIEYYVYL